MKKIVILFFFILISVDSFSLYANNDYDIFEDDNGVYQKLSDNTCMLLRFYYDSENLVIPSTAKNCYEWNSQYGYSRPVDEDKYRKGNNQIYTIVELLDGMFNYSFITSLTIPQTIRELGNRTFQGCRYLTKIIFNVDNSSYGNGLFIGERCFADCISLESLDLSEFVHLSGEGIFEGCTSLKEVNFIIDGKYEDPESGTFHNTAGIYISKRCFKNCSNLKVRSIKNISEDAQYRLPDIQLGDEAFANCTSLESIEFNYPEDPRHFIGDFIGDRAFQNCTGLNKNIKIVSSTLGFDVFDGCSFDTVRFDAGEIKCKKEGDKFVYHMPDCKYLNLIGNFKPYYLESYEKKNINIEEINLFKDLKSLKKILFGSLTWFDNDVYFCGDGETPFKLGFIENQNVQEIYLDVPLKSNSKYLFKNCKSLKKIVFPIYREDAESWSMPDNAFEGCSALDTLLLTGKIASIGKNAFVGCDNLKVIAICESEIEEIYAYDDGRYGLVFRFFDSFPYKPIKLGYIENANVKYIISTRPIITENKYLFKNCTSLESICFDYEHYWKDKMAFPDNAFEGCSSLKTIMFPTKISKIGNDPFKGCISLKKVEIGINDAVPYEIGYIASESIESIAIGGPFKTTNEYLLKNCTALKEAFIFGESPFSIPNKAIYECQTLEELYLWAVSEIGNFSFEGCKSLRYVKFFDNDLPIKLGYQEKGSQDNIYGKGLFYGCPLEEVYVGRTLSYNDSTQYGHSPFYDSKTLRKVKVGERCKALSDYLFYSCGELRELDIDSDSLKSIGNLTFAKCTGLHRIKFPKNLKSVGQGAFESCQFLNTVEMNDSLKSIGKNAFYGCYSLTGVTLPKSVASVGNSAFGACIGLKNLNIEPGKGAVKIGHEYKLDANGQTTSEFYPMFLKSPLEAVYIGKNFTFDEGEKYGYSPFAGNESLEEVVTYDSTKVIKDYSFYKCPKLAKITLGEKIQSIGNNAFAECSGIKEIDTKNPVPPTITANTFDGVNKKDCKVLVPEASLNAYKAAEYWKDFWNIVGVTETGIEVVGADNVTRGKAFNLQGLKVGYAEKGIVIQDGKKVLKK